MVIQVFEFITTRGIGKTDMIKPLCPSFAPVAALVTRQNNWAKYYLLCFTLCVYLTSFNLLNCLVYGLLGILQYWVAASFS